jgi:hypothetical protein
MINWRTLFLALAISLCCHSICTAQAYSLRITQNHFKLDAVDYDGFVTQFSQAHKEVKKEWWRYIKAKALIFNHKSYYELTIPTQKGSSNVPLKFVSQLSEDSISRISSLNCAIINDGMDTNDKKEFDKQLIVLLKDFKISYFTKLIQVEINKNESKAQEISTDMNKYYSSNSKLKVGGEKNPQKKSGYRSIINDNNKKIEALNIELRETETALDGLKNELNRIK